MYFTKTPKILQSVSNDLLWKIDTSKKEMYLTFDDGPIPEVTPAILDILDRYEAKATFFCVGDNVRKHRAIFEEILARKHAVGNHTFSHKNGWNTKLFSYLKDFMKCQDEMGENSLFRPPYGRILPQQIQALKDRTTVVMWDVLSGDFDPKNDFLSCAKNVIDHATTGSIIVFHDSLKAKEKVLAALPIVLEHFRDYKFKPLSSSL